jgi:hypothetical protein
VRIKGIRTGVIGLALSSIVANATAAEVCASAQDLTAMQVAAVQQKLMVAALSCNDSALYNDFVAAYQPDLVASDQALQAFFLRLNAETGAADYDTFKTKLANTYSLRSGGNVRLYCGTARTTFKTALAANRPSLKSFVLSQPMVSDARYGVCGETVAGGSVLMAPVQAAVAAAPAVATTAAVAAAASDVPAAAKAAAVAAASDVPAAKSPDAVSPGAAALPPASTVTASKANDNLNRYPNGNAPQQQQARRYDARDPRAPYPPPAYRQGYGDSYGYSNRYGERDPYYRNPYSRPQYRRVLPPPPPPDYYYYLRRR